MLKINCHWYSHEEIVEALKKKGYAVVHETETDRRGNTKNIWTAIKNGKTENLESVALREFHKKPPLV